MAEHSGLEIPRAVEAEAVALFKGRTSELRGEDVALVVLEAPVRDRAAGRCVERRQCTLVCEVAGERNAVRERAGELQGRGGLAALRRVGEEGCVDERCAGARVR